MQWFQALMPKEERFFDLFESHARTLSQGGHALVPSAWLIKLSSDRAGRWPSRLPLRLALVALLPLIPGAMIRAAWLVWFGR